MVKILNTPGRVRKTKGDDAWRAAGEEEGRMGRRSESFLHHIKPPSSRRGTWTGMQMGFSGMNSVLPSATNTTDTDTTHQGRLNKWEGCFVFFGSLRCYIKLERALSRGLRKSRCNLLLSPTSLLPQGCSWCGCDVMCGECFSVFCLRSPFCLLRRVSRAILSSSLG